MTTREAISGKSPRLNLKITEEIIAESCRADSSHCMIAEALKVAVPDAQRVTVDLQTIRYTDSKTKQRYVYLTPRRGQEALVSFDQGETVEPFGLYLSTAAQITTAKARGTGKIKRPNGGSNAPVRVGGTTPPLSPLAWGEGVAAADATLRPDKFAKPQHEVAVEASAKPQHEVAVDAQHEVAVTPQHEVALTAEHEVSGEPQREVAGEAHEVAVEATETEPKVPGPPLNNERAERVIGRRREFGMHSLRR